MKKPETVKSPGLSYPYCKTSKDRKTGEICDDTVDPYTGSRKNICTDMRTFENGFEPLIVDLGVGIDDTERPEEPTVQNEAEPKNSEQLISVAAFVMVGIAAISLLYFLINTGINLTEVSPCKRWRKTRRYDYGGVCMDCADDLGISEHFEGHPHYKQHLKKAAEKFAVDVGTEAG